MSLQGVKLKGAFGVLAALVVVTCSIQTTTAQTSAPSSSTSATTETSNANAVVNGADRLADCSVLQGDVYSNSASLQSTLQAEFLLKQYETVVWLVENCRRKAHDGTTAEITVTIVTSTDRQIQANLLCTAGVDNVAATTTEATAVTEAAAAAETAAGGGVGGGASAGVLSVHEFSFPSLTAEPGPCQACLNSSESACLACNLLCENGGALLQDCSACLCIDNYYGQTCQHHGNTTTTTANATDVFSTTPENNTSQASPVPQDTNTTANTSNNTSSTTNSNASSSNTSSNSNSSSSDNSSSNASSTGSNSDNSSNSNTSSTSNINNNNNSSSDNSNNTSRTSNSTSNNDNTSSSSNTSSTSSNTSSTSNSDNTSSSSNTSSTSSNTSSTSNSSTSNSDNTSTSNSSSNNTSSNTSSSTNVSPMLTTNTSATSAVPDADTTPVSNTTRDPASVSDTTPVSNTTRDWVSPSDPISGNVTAPDFSVPVLNQSRSSYSVNDTNMANTTIPENSTSSTTQTQTSSDSPAAFPMPTDAYGQQVPAYPLYPDPAWEMPSQSTAADMASASPLDVMPTQSSTSRSSLFAQPKTENASSNGSTGGTENGNMTSSLSGNMTSSPSSETSGASVNTTESTPTKEAANSTRAVVNMSTCRCDDYGFCQDEYTYEPCSCPPGLTGRECDVEMNSPCSSLPCAPNATCITSSDSHYLCRCPFGFEGDACDVNTDDCLGNECNNNATCVDGVGEYVCRCPSGYDGKLCDIPGTGCTARECLNGGACREMHNSMRCLCLWGFTGESCEVEILDHCASHPCDPTAVCTSLLETFECECFPGTSGKYCNITQCSAKPCKNDALCLLDRQGQYNCTCSRGWTGQNCTDPVLSVCSVHGCSENRVCDRSAENCVCKAGHIGQNCTKTFPETCVTMGCNSTEKVCDVRTGLCDCRSGPDGDQCRQDNNECLSAPCANGAACIDTRDGYTCKCLNGYYGSRCDACPQACTADKERCGINGRCETLHCPRFNNLRLSDDIPVAENEHNGTRCICDDGYYGEYCQYQLHQCGEVDACENGGICKTRPSEAGPVARCMCGMRWTGTTCTECTKKCIHGNVDKLCRTCMCKSGWEGESCDECSGVIQGQECLPQCSTPGFEPNTFMETVHSVCFACGIHNCISCNRPPFEQIQGKTSEDTTSPKVCTECELGSKLIKGRCLGPQDTALVHPRSDRIIIIAVSGGVFVLAILLLVVAFFIYRRNKKESVYKASAYSGESSFVAANPAAKHEDVELQSMSASKQPASSNGRSKAQLLNHLSDEFPTMKMVTIANAVQKGNFDVDAAREILTRQLNAEGGSNGQPQQPLKQSQNGISYGSTG